jgi:Protein of unknown function (DUF2844)
MSRRCIAMRKLYWVYLALALSGAFSFMPPISDATLGEPADSIDSDRAALSAVRRAQNVYKSYTVQEITSDSVSVREYVSTSGIVFGVAWNGLVNPDLTQLLGSYAGEYRDALQRMERTRGRRSLQIKSDGVVVEKWGHMRNLQGRAYAPALLPPGVSVDEIQ